MHCDYCRARVKYQAHVCPACQHLLANDIKLRRVVGRISAAALGSLALIGFGILIGLYFF